MEDSKAENDKVEGNKVEDKMTSDVPPKQQKLSLKDLSNLTGQLLKDLRQLQREGQTLPDILYNYRIQDGRLVRKRARKGSFAGGRRGIERMVSARRRSRGGNGSTCS